MVKEVKEKQYEKPGRFETLFIDKIRERSFYVEKRGHYREKRRAHLL